MTDLQERMYDSDDGRRIVGEDVRKFIDVETGWRVLTTEYLLALPDSNAF